MHFYRLREKEECFRQLGTRSTALHVHGISHSRQAARRARVSGGRGKGRMLQHAPLCTRARRNFCARVPAAPDRAADRGVVRNAQSIHNTVKAENEGQKDYEPSGFMPIVILTFHSFTYMMECPESTRSDFRSSLSKNTHKGIIVRAFGFK